MDENARATNRRPMNAQRPSAVPRDNGRYSKVTRRLWTDEGFRRLSRPPPNGQTLWLRLLTGTELTNIPGLIFPAWPSGMAEALGWTKEGFLKAFAEVFREGMAEADWEAGLIWVPKAIRHNKPESPNVVKSWRMAWAECPECALKVTAYQSFRAFLEGFGEAFLKAFEEGCADPSRNQEQEQEQEQEQKERVRGAPTAPPPPADDPAAGKRRGCRLPKDWQPCEDLVDKYRMQGVDALGSLKKFKNHWLSTTKNATKLDWDLTFENWVDTDIEKGVAKKVLSEYEPPKAKAGDGPPPPEFTSSLRAMMDNFADPFGESIADGINGVNGEHHSVSQLAKKSATTAVKPKDKST